MLRATLLRGATLPHFVENLWQVAPRLAEPPRRRLLDFGYLQPSVSKSGELARPADDAFVAADSDDRYVGTVRA